MPRLRPTKHEIIFPQVTPAPRAKRVRDQSHRNKGRAVTYPPGITEQERRVLYDYRKALEGVTLAQARRVQRLLEAGKSPHQIALGMCGVISVKQIRHIERGVLPAK